MNSGKAISEITAVSVKQAVESPTPTVGAISLVSQEAALKIVVLMLAEVNEFFNVGKPMGDAQAVATARLILTNQMMKNMKPEDFKVCFDRAKAGVYGKVYDRIDGNMVFEWLNAYLSERMEFVENESIINHSRNKTAGHALPEGLAEMYREMVKMRPGASDEARLASLLEGDKPNDEDMKKAKRKPIVKTPRDQKIQELFREFFDLWVKQGEPSDGAVKYIRFEDRKMDEIEYVTMKIKQYDYNQIA